MSYGLLLLQIATRSSKWGKHVAKKTVVPLKGLDYFISLPSRFSCTLQCNISGKRSEGFSHPENSLVNDSSREFLRYTRWQNVLKF